MAPVYNACVNCVQNPQIKHVHFILGKNEHRWIVWIQQRRRWTNVILITASTTICRDYYHLNGKSPLVWTEVVHSLLEAES